MFEIENMHAMLLSAQEFSWIRVVGAVFIMVMVSMICVGLFGKKRNSELNSREDQPQKAEEIQ